MAFTYSGDPSASNKDWVRWRIGDTSTSDQLLLDGEITAAVSEYGNKRRAAAECARSIAAKFARDCDTAVGDLRTSLSQRHDHYLALAEEIEERATFRAKPYMGGSKESDKKSQRDDTDRVTPAFGVAQFDSPGTSDYESQDRSTV